MLKRPFFFQSQGWRSIPFFFFCIVFLFKGYVVINVDIDVIICDEVVNGNEPPSLVLHFIVISRRFGLVLGESFETTVAHRLDLRQEVLVDLKDLVGRWLDLELERRTLGAHYSVHWVV